MRRLALVAAALALTPASAAGAATIRATMDRTTVEFGDPVTVTATVFLDRTEDPDEFHLELNLAPLTQLGPTRVTHAVREDVQTITYTAVGSCLDLRCISKGASKRVVLRPVRVSPPPVRVGETKAPWPTLDVRRRVPQTDLVQTPPPLRSDVSPPPVTYRVGPTGLARTLDGVAAMLAAAGLALGGWTAIALYRRRRRRARPLTELQRALALARQAEQRPPPDRRRALGLLARLVGARNPALAGAADDLAWSAPAPTGDDVAAVVSRVEREVNGA